MTARLRRLLAMLSLERLAGQTLAAFALKGAGAVASFALAWLVARQFGAAGSGLFGITVTTVTFVGTLLLCGVDTQLLRIAAGDLKEGKQADARALVRRVSRWVLLTAPLAAVALWLGHDWLARHVLDQPAVAPLLAVMLWALVPLTLIRIASATLRAYGQVMASQLIDGPLGTALAAAALGAFLLAGGLRDLQSVGLFYLAGASIGCIAGWIAWRRRHGRADAPAAASGMGPGIAPLLLAGAPVLFAALSNLFTEWFTTVHLGAKWDAATVGQYRVAWQFVGLLGLVQIAMDAILAPRIAAAARVGDKAEIGNVARRGALLVMALGLPLLLLFLAVPEVFLGLFGPEFVAGATALRILAAGQMVRLAGGPLGTIIIMTGNQRWILGYAALGVLLCTIFCIAFIPPLGASGAALAATATITLRTLAAMLIVRHVIGINILGRRPR